MTGFHDWKSLSAAELKALITDASVAILPVAAVEQHGAHLPLATDVIIGEGLLADALARCRPLAADLFVLPTVTVASSLEHTAFAGTLSLAPETAIAVIEDIGASAARAGIRRLLIFNSHGGNKSVVDIAALKLRAAYGLLVVKASYFRFAPPPDVLSAHELTHGLHGGALETSLMLHFAPDQVRRDQLAEAESLGARRERAGATLWPEGDAGFAWMAQDLHPRGVTGNARLASAEHGATLCAQFAARLARIIEETAAFELRDLND